MPRNSETPQQAARNLAHGKLDTLKRSNTNRSGESAPITENRLNLVLLRADNLCGGCDRLVVKAGKVGCTNPGSERPASLTGRLIDGDLLPDINCSGFRHIDTTRVEPSIGPNGSLSWQPKPPSDTMRSDL